MIMMIASEHIGTQDNKLKHSTELPKELMEEICGLSKINTNK